MLSKSQFLCTEGFCRYKILVKKSFPIHHQVIPIENLDDHEILTCAIQLQATSAIQKPLIQLWTEMGGCVQATSATLIMKAISL